MKNRDRSDYKSLQRKIYLKVALITATAFLAVLSLRILTWGRFADYIVAFVERVFEIPYDEAAQAYQIIIRNNMDFIMFAAVAVFFIILSRFLLTQFTKYFGEISKGLDTLTKDVENEIKLSPELSAMERKINAVSRTLEKRERDAKQAEQRKNDVVMYLAHDIKTPLTSVIGYLSLLDEAADMPREQRAKYVGISLEKAIRLEELVDEFFEVTRYNLQTISLSRREIDLCCMMTQMADEFYPLLSAKGKRAELEVPENLTVYGDPDKLARVFNNILKNAVAY